MGPVEYIDTAAVRALGDAWSLHVVDVATRRTLVAHQPRVPRVPASNVKIITAVAALLAFGPAHRFVSTVHMGPGARVTVRGGGDPDLSSDAIEAVADAVARRVGPGAPLPRVYLDQSLYPPFTPAPGWRPGFLPWEVRPVVPLSVGVPGSTTPHVRGGMQVAAVIGRHTGGAVSMGAGAVPAGAECIARVQSASVEHLVRLALLHSDSDVSEVLARNVAIGRGVPPTWEGVEAALDGAMRDAGFDMTGCRLVDGSGLSGHTGIRADLITQVLCACVGPGANPALGAIVDALPVAGRTGTLGQQEGWFDDPAHAGAHGRVRAKTGTLRDVCALSGYAEGPDGSLRAFALLVNDVDGVAARAPVSAVVAQLAT